MKEDPRLFVKPDGNLGVLYTAKKGIVADTRLCYFEISPNIYPYPTSVNFSETVLLNHSLHQKNWIPFTHGEDTYFIKRLNPLSIYKLTPHIYEEDVGGPRPIPSQVLHHVFHSNKSIHLPWREEYGSSIRGGTPAILVQGYYLLFFHTVARLQKLYDLKTYMMGAMTLCPDFPFRIHSMSLYPIVNKSWYQGEWVEQPKIDYVMFPMGLILDPNDDDFVLVSLGHNDKDGWIAKFEIEGLYNSLKVVDECTNN